MVDNKKSRVESNRWFITAVHGLTSSLLRLSIRFIVSMPRALIPTFAAALGLLMRPLARRDFTRLRANVQHIFGLPAGSHFSQMFEKQVFRHQIICALETFKVVFGNAPVEISGQEELRARVAAAEAQGKPHIFVTAHLGSWELCAQHCALSSRQAVHVLAKPPRFVPAKTLLEDMRRQMGVTVLWTGAKSLLRDMLGAMQRNEALGFVMDQKPEGRKGPVVPFFGRPTPFVSGPAAMALRFDATVIALFCVREGPFRFRILSETIRSPKETSDIGVDETELTLTERMAAVIEAAIRTYPEQWTWSYKRWRF